jgi:hypothetical protein
MELNKLREKILSGGGRMGPLHKGQHWIELHGTFTYADLMSIASTIQKVSKGLDHGDKK